jgi:hypothetical protein
MKIKIYIPRDVALMQGSDQHGDMIVDVPAANLSPAHRAALTGFSAGRDCDYDLSLVARPGYAVAIPGLSPPHEATAEGLQFFLARLIKRRHEIEEVNAQKQAQSEAARRAEAEALAQLPVAEQVADSRSDCGFQPRALLLNYPDLCGPAQTECDRLNAAQAEADRQQQAEKEAAAADQRSWIEAHGSPRLRRLLIEQIEHGAVYRDERLAYELPQWVFDSNELTSDLAEPRNPPQTALDLLDRARTSRPAAKLLYWTRNARYEHGEEIAPAARGYAATDQFLGDRILLF